MTTITLPIKCSTVKRVDNACEWIIFVEGTILAILGLIAFILFVYMSVFHGDVVSAKPSLWLMYYFAMMLPVIYCMAVNPFQYLPKIELACIKDD
jgi:fatty acid desaturase